MSDTLLRITEYLTRSKQARVLLEEETTKLDTGIIKMVVDALPEFSFGEEFRKRLTEMLKDKLSPDKIDKVAQVLVMNLPTSAENILKSLTI